MSLFKLYGCLWETWSIYCLSQPTIRIWINASHLRHRSLKKPSTDWRAPSTTCRCCCNVDAVCTMCECIHSLSNPLSWSSLAWFLDFCKCRCEYNMHFLSFNPKWLLPLMVVPSLLESSFGIWCLWPWRFLQGSCSGFLMPNANGAENDECGWPQCRNPHTISAWWVDIGK